MDNTNQRQVTMCFDKSDLPMLLSSLRIGRNTAMLGGRGEAQDRLNALIAMVTALLPPCHAFFRSEVWCEVGLALQTGKKWFVYLDNKYHGYNGELYSKYRYVSQSIPFYICVDDRKWRDYRWTTYTDEDVAAVRELVASLAPITCEEDESLAVYEDLRKG